MLLDNLKTQAERREYFKIMTYGAWIWESKDNKLVCVLENFGECACGFKGMAKASDVPKFYQFCNIYKKNDAAINKGKLMNKKREYIKSLCRECAIKQVEVIE
jgi:hypothetical protein